MHDMKSHSQDAATPAPGTDQPAVIVELGWAQGRPMPGAKPEIDPTTWAELGGKDSRLRERKKKRGKKAKKP